MQQTMNLSDFGRACEREARAMGLYDLAVCCQETCDRLDKGEIPLVWRGVQFDCDGMPIGNHTCDLCGTTYQFPEAPGESDIVVCANCGSIGVMRGRPLTLIPITLQEFESLSLRTQIQITLYSNAAAADYKRRRNAN